MTPEPGRQPGPALRFGVFLAPFHAVGRNPTLALERDLELIEALDRLGFDEVWVGEHHSGGSELIASPEVFLAVAAQRTRHIRLGTGVSSLPYHHPLLLADRMVLLDHLTRGRVMFGVGPGALPSDASMLGIDPRRQRAMMEESLEAILALLAGEVPVTFETDWFSLREARLQLLPYQRPCFEVAVAALISPSGPRLAGRFGTGLLSIGATSPPGFEVLASHWRIMEERARQFGTTVDRQRWRLVGPVHLAPTESQARRDVEHGLADWVAYFRDVAALPLAPGVDDPAEVVDAMCVSGLAVVGTPEQAVAQLERLVEGSGGFGTFLVMAHEWADEAATLRSMELFSSQVFPHFQHSGRAAAASRDWAASHRRDFMAASGEAILRAVQDHHFPPEQADAER
ncbi:MAG TPA: LLM class flavin-dependent oxidoreductase [Acidimicrobiales bacterium]|nr:LLM class flavin-dependent oxidoreductase [Acidimicrobiales bacterium]